MRILLITSYHPLPTNPARGTFISDRVELLREMGHEVKVINPLPRMLKRSETRRSTLTGVAKAPLYSIPLSDKSREVFHPRYFQLPSPSLSVPMTNRSVKKLMTKASKWLGNWRPDVISSHSIWPVANLAESLAKFYSVKWYVTVHGYDFDVGLKRPQRKEIIRLCESANQLVIVANNQEKYISSIHLTSQPLLIPCHAEVGKEWSQPMRKPLRRWRKSKLEILFPADPRRPEKRHLLALRACSELETRGWVVNFGGLKQVPRDMVWDRMVTCDLALITSERETGPLVAREAILCGLPVVGVDVGDLATWLPKRCISFSDTPTALADAMEEVLSSEVEDFTVPEGFSPDSVKRQLEELFTLLQGDGK